MDLRSLESNPDFASVSYEEQLKLRTLWVGQIFKTRPEIQLLPAQDRDKLFDQLVFRPPVLAVDKNLEGYAAQIGAAARGGNKQAISEIAMLLGQDELKNSGVVKMLLTKWIDLPFAKRLAKADQEAAGEPGPFAAAAARDAQYTTLRAMVLEQEKGRTPDQRKVMDYLKTLASEDERIRRKWTVFKGMGMVAEMGEIIMMNSVLLGTMAAPKLLGKLAVAPWAKAWSMAKTTWGQTAALAGAGLSHAAVGGLLGVARENAKLAILDQLPYDGHLQTAFQNNIRYFNNYALWDVIVNMATGLLVPALRTGGRAFTKYGRASMALGELSEENFKTYLRETTAGRMLDKTLLNQLDLHAKRNLLTQLRTFQTFQHVPDLADPYVQLNFVATHSNWGTSLDEATGRVSLWKMSNTNFPTKTFSNIDDATKYLERQIGQIAKTPAIGAAAMTKAEFYKAMKATDVGLTPGANETARLKINKYIQESTGITDPQQYANYLRDQFNISKPIVVSEGEVKGAQGFLSSGEDRWDLILDKKNTSKLTTVRHEVEHILDEMSGLPSGGERGPLHHARMPLDFNTDYFHRISIKQALLNGEKVPSKVLAEYPDLEKWASKAGINPSAADLGLVGASAQRLTIRKFITGKLKKGSEQDIMLLSRLMAPVGGVWGRSQVGTFTKAIVRHLGLEDSLLKGFSVRGGENLISVLDKEGKVFFSFPRKVIGGDEIPILGEFFDKLSGLGVSKVERTGFMAGYVKGVVEQDLDTPLWTKYMVGTKLSGKLTDLPDGKVLMELPSGGGQQFDSHGQLRNWLVAQNLSEADFKGYLAKYHGVKMSKEDNLLVFRQGGKEIARETDVATFLGKHPEFEPKIPAELGPEFTYQNGELFVKYYKGTVTGGTQALYRHLSKFASLKKARAVLPITPFNPKGTILMDITDRSLEVYIPEIEYRFPVGSAEEGKAWLRKGLDDLDLLTKVSFEKGYRLRAWQGKWLLHSDGGQEFIANSSEELKTLLRKAPTPEWLPELVNISSMDPNEQAVTYGRPPANFIPALDPEGAWVPTSRELPSMQKLGFFYRPPDAALVDAIEHGGHPKILEFFRGTETALRVSRGEEQKLLSAAESIFSRTGKTIKSNRRAFVWEYKTAKGEDIKELVKVSRKLTEDELKASGLLHDFLGRTPEEGLFQRYMVDPKLFLEDYLPRLYKEFGTRSFKKLRLSSGSMRELLEDTFGPNPPHELSVFFKNIRLEEARNLAMETDPLKLIQKYIAIGERNKWVAPIWEDFDKWAKLHGKEVDPTLLRSFMTYRSQIMGLPQSFSEDTLRSVSGQIAKRLGLKDENLHKDLVKAIMGYGYTTSMGYRLWPVIRNYFQIWTTLAPRIGNHWTMMGVQRLAGDLDGSYFAFLRTKGVLSTNLPVYGAELIESSKLSKLAHSGLKWYKNVDDMTRAIAYASCEAKFADAAERVGRLKLTWKQFEDISGVYQLADDLKLKIQGHISKGEWLEAKDIFSNSITQETMFPYRAGHSPLMFRGTVGRLFGMMGHYPVWYIENLRRAVKYSSPAQKLAFAGRFMANTTALYHLFKDGLGINAMDFQWYAPMSFSGGPYYQMMNQALQSMDFRSYKGRQARAELWGWTTKDGKPHFQPEKAQLTKWLIGFQTFSLINGIKAWNEGEYYKATLNFLSAPIDKEHFADAEESFLNLR